MEDEKWQKAFYYTNLVSNDKKQSKNKEEENSKGA
jgi:hypothetical protein